MKVRKQVLISLEQAPHLRDYARYMGISESEIVRRGIQQVLDAAELEREQIREAQAKRGWTRDDIYEDRMNQITHIGPYDPKLRELESHT